VLETVIKAFILVFAAEIGDKTQMLTMTFAKKYETQKILIGIVIGSFLNHGIAVLLAYFLASKIHIVGLQLLAAFVFFVFSVMSLKREERKEEDRNESYVPIIAVASAFFLGELGDKTQISVIGLTVGSSLPIAVLIGSVSAMIVAGICSIIIGKKMEKHVPEIPLKILASFVFFVFAILKFVNSPIANKFPSVIFWGLIILGGILYSLAIRLFWKDEKIQILWLKSSKEKLKVQNELLAKSIDSLCLNCGDKCIGDRCIIGWLKQIIDTDEEKNKLLFTKIDDLEIKESFNIEKSIVSLGICLRYEENFMMQNKNGNLDKIEYIRKMLEKLIFGKIVCDKFVNMDDFISRVKNENDILGNKIENQVKQLELPIYFDIINKKEVNI